ncbi:MAG: helix-turn-helix transcriptional regulator, partial [Gaiellaceae bacterium]
AGEHARARERVAALRAAAGERELPRFLAWADRGEGLLLAAQGDLDGACAALESALAQHERVPIPLERGRTLLIYGNVLRRARRRRAARETLGEALAEFERIGAGHFARRAAAELKHVAGRAPRPEGELTQTEDRVARLVASGLSNREVAGRLFVTVSTVEATLGRVYAKLGIRSRLQLARALDDPGRDPSGPAE